MKKNKRAILLLLILGLCLGGSSGTVIAQVASGDMSVLDSTNYEGIPWFRKIHLRGYAQLRYNGLLQTNPDLNCNQCDVAWGGNGGFSFRRIRLVFYGQVGERLYIYIQPDFASSSGSNLHYGQIRDAYFDFGLSKDNTFRLRFGQSKVPFGFENMQSSQNRLPLDRSDGINSAFRNERDLGVFFYWAPKHIRRRFSDLVAKGLKGSGDYGVFAFGVFNGQVANRADLNNSQHMVTRVSYPFELKNKQIIEPGIQFYTGKHVVGEVSEGVITKENSEYLDSRGAVSFVLYPQPFGLQAEYNIGTGPEYNANTNEIEQKRLKGGYVMANYRIGLDNGKQALYPFVRYHYYDGGKKFELDARSYEVKETEIGAEWQPFKYMELVAMYTVSNRRYEDAELPINHQKGNLLRLQVQFNF
ncbi:porin [Olivibacter sitiensis]|uniref:porin n=1 Tax=Olivibacter sitiensis TaxID=376470 RepID=UPI0004060DBD|nr:porin [Olivibacter sitiensis]